MQTQVSQWLRFLVYLHILINLWLVKYIEFIAPDKALFFQPKHIDIFLIVPQQHVLSAHLKHLAEALLMSTHNIFFVEK